MNNTYAPRLRILLDPVYVQQSNLSSSSTYFKYVSLVKEFVSRGHFVYWCIPDTDYVPNEIENHPNVGIIRTSSLVDQFVVDGMFTDKFFDLFNRTSGKYHIDLMITSRNSLALLYKRMLEPPRFMDLPDEFSDKSYGLPVALLEEFPQTQERQHSARGYFLNQCLGYISSDLTVFLSDHNRSEIISEMRDYITMSQIKEWSNNYTKIIPAGVECEELDKYYNPDRYKVEEGFNVLTIGRIFGVSYTEFLPWFNYVYKSGQKATITVSLSGRLSAPMKVRLAKEGFDVNKNTDSFKLIENNPRANFLPMISKYHCFIAPVSHLDHPTGIFEALYLGLPGILPESDYQQTFFKDYPFVINPKKPEELVATLNYIREDPARAREMVKPWRDIIREKYDARKNIKVLANELESVARDYIQHYKIPKGVQELVNQLKAPKYTLSDVIQFLKTTGEQGGLRIGDNSARLPFSYANGSIHHSMRYHNYVDLCDSDQPNFLRRDLYEQQIQGVSNGTTDKPKIKRLIPRHKES
jgi:glycosyltransferase involved in cell wall biosynthesis